MDHKPLTNIFGRSGRKVSRVGLGGEGVLRTYGRTDEARQVIQEALRRDLTYFDSARVYADSEVYYGSVWKEQPEKRAVVFQASKSASRDKTGALEDLEQTLQRLQTDYLDLWQIHDVRTVNDLEVISGPGGALDAFVEARSSGKVKFIGVTGHHDPRVLTTAVNDWPVDAVMIPVNPVEAILGGFLTSTLAAAREKGIAIIGMKILGASHFMIPHLDITADLLIRFALSYDITVAIVGCSTATEVQTLADIGCDRTALTDSERSRIFSAFQPLAGRMAYYRGVM